MMNSSYPLVAIIILNWNNDRDVLTCLLSLKKVDYPNIEIWIVDNGSTDPSSPIFQEYYPEAHVLRLSKNLGYTGGNNVGIQQALDHHADWVFLLNNDTTLAPDALSSMISVGQNRSDIGVIGPTIYHTTAPDIIQTAGGLLDQYLRTTHRGLNQVDRGQFLVPTGVDWVSGCALLARSVMIRQIGLLDDRFFMYNEELDWCIRAKLASWQIMHVPDAHVWHAGVNPTYLPNPYVTYYMVRNRFLLLSKHHASIISWLDTSFQVIRTLLSWSVRPKWKEKKIHRDAMWRGTIDFLRHRWGRMTPEYNK